MDLTETAGRRPWGSYCLKLLILTILVVGVFSLLESCASSLRGGALAPLTNSFLFLLLFIVVYFIALSVLPAPLKRLFKKLNRFILSIGKKILLWAFEMVKEFLRLMLYW
jgi:hypothetical protein